MTTSHAILRALLERWPSREIPMGGVKTLADELKVPRERVATVQRKHGFRIVPKNATKSPSPSVDSGAQEVV